MTTNRFPTPCVQWVPTCRLDQMAAPSFYWAHILRYSLDTIPELNLKAIPGVIFTGPPGNGRHLTAEALAGTLVTEKGFYCLRINAAAMDTEDVSDACAVLDAVAATIRSGSKRVCALLDAPERSRHSHAIQEYFYQIMQDWKDLLFPIIITRDASGLSSDLLRSLTHCPCPKPDRMAREAWLKDTLGSKRYPIPLVGGMDHSTLAASTDGFSWKQLTDLRTMLRRTIVTKYHRSQKVYNPAGIEGLEKTLFKEGRIPLTSDDVNQILMLLRHQDPPAAAAVQYVAAAPAGSAPSPISAAPPQMPAADADADVTQITMNQEEAKKAQEFYSKPEAMTVDQLFDILKR